MSQWYVWDADSADIDDCVSLNTTVKKALGAKFDLYVEALAVLFGVITPGKSDMSFTDY